MTRKMLTARGDAFTLVWAGEWVVDLARMTADLDGPVRQLIGRPAAPAQPG